MLLGRSVMPARSRNAYLSKTLYMKGLQCHKFLYLNRKRPDLKGEQTPELKARLKAGTEVGVYAQQLFPGGVAVPFDGLTKGEQLVKTRKEVSGGARVIYEATFSFDNVFFKADIIRKDGRGWELYEVKSATRVKDHYPDDVAIQFYVLKGCGVNVRRAFLVHVNNEYVRNGEIVPKGLFSMQDVTEEVKDIQAEIPTRLASMRKMLYGKLPAIDIGPHCFEPNECDFMEHCWEHVPEYSIFNLKGRGVDKWELYGRGILKLADVPLEILNDSQRMQAEQYRRRGEHADPEGIREFLKRLWYPLCFLDFETIQTAIPLFDGNRPYQQIPFQYSLHLQKSAKLSLKHFEFLARPGVDPRRELTERIIREIPEEACVMVYHKTFEKGVLSDLAESFPQYRKRLDGIIDNLVDLMEPFQRRDIYHWEMDGSYSLKAVLPVLVPDMTYEGMEISEGKEASLAYLAMIEGSVPEEYERLRKALLTYCRQDTLGLVKLLERMWRMT
jgi:hypothetical protein